MQTTRPLLLPPCPQAGSGVHSWLLSAANLCRIARLSEADAEQVICGAMTRRPSPANEVRDAIRKAYSSTWTPNTHPTFAPPPPKWPAVNEEQQTAIIRDGGGLVELWETSPVRIHDDGQHTEEIIDRLFPGEPLLCCGLSNSSFHTKPRGEWRGQLSKQQLIVPSPMTSRTGLTKEGKESEHSLNNTGDRRFLICEFDRGTTDAHAALLLHLARLAPLVCAVHSGGKSLHGWFYVQGQPEEKVNRFFRYAVSLGADRATWTRSQFVRMPDGTRDNGRIQRVYFLNYTPLEASR